MCLVFQMLAVARFKQQNSQMNSKNIMKVLAFCLPLLISVLAVQPGALNGMASGTIYIGGTDLSAAGTSKIYTVTFSHNVGTDPVSYALALAGFQSPHNQLQYHASITSTTITNSNTVMIISLDFATSATIGYTEWIQLKWTYLVVSSTFDGTYSNVWTSFVDLQNPTLPITNLPIDPVGTAFLAMGGSPGDCKIYVNPLMQVDLVNCQPIAVADQFKGGKIIIHAYVSGFFIQLNAAQNNTISVKNGGPILSSDSAGWQIAYSAAPNGPLVTIAASLISILQISFVITRMDYYAPHYPLNSILQYSSSHIYTFVSALNQKVVISHGGISQYNQNYFALPDATYLIYGLSSFTFSLLNSPYSLIINLDPHHYWVNIPNANCHSVVVSADLFIKNIMSLCDSKNNEFSLKGKSKRIQIRPVNSIYSVVDATTFLATQEMTASTNPIVHKYCIASTTDTKKVTFKNVYRFQKSTQASTLKIQLKYFQDPNTQSLIVGRQYEMIVKVNGIIIFEQIYTHGVTSPNFISNSIFRGVPIKANTRIRVVVIVKYKSGTSSQEFYILLAVYQENIVYLPQTKQCRPSCPIGSAINAQLIPLTCYPCDTLKGMTYNIKQAKCTCKQGTVLSPSSSLCQPCGPNCLQCLPDNPLHCLSCPRKVPLINNECGCRDGKYITEKGCVPCPSECQTCVAPDGLCLTCKKIEGYNHNICKTCTCASGFYDHGLGDCGQCATNCLTCSSHNPCLSCDLSSNRQLSNGDCICKTAYFQQMDYCQPCDPTCLSCSGSFDICESCQSTYNRILEDEECVCKPNYLQAGIICVMSNCPSDPLCYSCIAATSGMKICVSCVPDLNRTLNSTINRCVCDKGYYDYLGLCKPCAPGCQQCIDYQHCIACATLAIPQQNGSCICPPKTYLTVIQDNMMFCKNCPQLCSECTDSTHCLKCYDNAQHYRGVCSCIDRFFLNSSVGYCQPCSCGCAFCTDQGCLTCQSPLVLSVGKCQPSCNFGFNQVNRVCQPCVPKCAQCLDHSTCQVCQDGFYLHEGMCVKECPCRTVGYLDCYGVPVCKSCVSPCMTCTLNPNNCQSCQPNYYLHQGFNGYTCERSCPKGTIKQGKICQKCIEGCLSCIKSPQYCIQCVPTLMIYKGSCVTQCNGVKVVTSQGQKCYDDCPPGSFDNGSALCQPCACSCNTCDRTKTNCTSCKTGILVDYGVCTPTCYQNQYVVGGICYNCTFPCTKCFRQSDFCVGCSTGMIVSKGSCVIDCPLKQYYHRQKMTCLACRQGCSSCSDAKICLTCIDSTFTPIRGQCPYCAPPCLSCNRDNRCKSCKSGTYLFNGACVTSCPGNTIRDGKRCICSDGVLQHDRCISSCYNDYFSLNRVCQLCHPDCRKCSSYDTCTYCFDGFNLNSQGKCQSRGYSCPYGQTKQNRKCVRQCQAPLYFYQGFCYTNCQHAQYGYVANQFGGCIRNWKYQCPENRFYLNGQCVRKCERGYFVDTDHKLCVNCPHKCQQCTNQDECVKCQDDYTNIKGVCYFSDCEDGKLAVGNQCLRICPEGTIQKKKICVPRCAAGSYYYDQLCYSTCPSGENNHYACTNVNNSTCSTPTPSCNSCSTGNCPYRP